jgi:3-deoxy-7-phosphoheptulonate synthase
MQRSHGEIAPESSVATVEKGGDRMVIGMQSGAQDRVRDLRIGRIVELVPPAMLLADLPLGGEREKAVVRRRGEVGSVLSREDDRLLVVVGPCSVHDVDAALDYAGRLSRVSGELEDDLVIAMRVYFEKPRTTTGWKGLINDPGLDGSCDVNAGLRMARALLLKVLDLDLAVGCEFLDPITPQYISDTVSWGAIGARTTESQIHRQLGSGLSMPIGFKNRTDGDVQVAVDAVRAAAVPHAFAGIDDNGAPAILHTTGNPDGHVILRGGGGIPNYEAGAVDGVLGMLSLAGLPERVVIDASHGNSDKDPERQVSAAESVAEQVAGGNEAIVGLMLESFLVAGRQDLDGGGELVYGQSVTDPCIDWEATVALLRELAGAVRARRGR